MNIHFVTGKREKLEMKPLNKQRLEKLRRKRAQEVEMLSLIKQILIYAIYLMFLLFLSQQNRNSNAFLINQNIKSMFVDFDESNYEQVRLYWFFRYYRGKICSFAFVNW